MYRQLFLNYPGTDLQRYIIVTTLAVSITRLNRIEGELTDENTNPYLKSVYDHDTVLDYSPHRLVAKTAITRAGATPEHSMTMS